MAEIIDAGKYFKRLMISLSMMGLFGPILFVVNREIYYTMYLQSFKIILPLILLSLVYVYLMKFSKLFSKADLLISRYSTRSILVSILYYLILPDNVFSATLFFSISVYLIFFPTREDIKDILFIFIAAFSFYPRLQILPIITVLALQIMSGRKISGLYLYSLILLFTQYVSSNFFQYHKSFHLLNSYVALLYVMSYVSIKESWRINKKNLLRALHIAFIVFSIEFFFAVMGLKYHFFDFVYNCFMIFVVSSLLFVSLSM